ncbi:hypothetical protein B0H16DRAFT_1745939 [Mycena metata]|uniref:Uncharacterized protein n=1 Tax=Mycena metata TaxID=1033252 RepID=A0AAD7H0Q8_9AGAR|nr:hypothetical protein B0H16DRAFT_1745939 [Mycena metata]
MAKASKISGKAPVKSATKVMPTRATKKKGTSNRFVDDEAADSDDGVLVEREEESEPYDMDPNEADLAFIDDGDVDGTLSANSSVDDANSPSDLAGEKRGSTQKTRRVAGSVIDIQDSSSEEDLTAMAVDDTALPSPLATRSTAKARFASPIQNGKTLDGKQKGSTLPAAQKSSSDVPLPFQMSAEQLAQFNAWMATKSGDLGLETGQRTPVRRQKIEVASEVDTAFQAGPAPAKALRDISPDWVLPLAISDQPEVIKGKKRTASARKASVPQDEENSDVESRREKSTAKRSSRSIGTYMDQSPAPRFEGAVEKPRGLTMAQFFSGKRAAKREEEFEISIKNEGLSMGNPDDSVDGPDVEPPSTAFLEDLETYKAYFDPRASCGVNDPELQDPVLAPGYVDLHPLPGGRQILPAFEPQGMLDEDTGEFKGGRVNFSSWKRHLKHMLADNAIGALVFQEAEPNFINPSRVSPLRLSRQASTGSNPTYRLLVGTRIATCVSALFCSESVVVEPAKIGAKSERMRKWISGIFHNQEWERFEALMCLVFGESVMYSQITPKKAVAFQTMISPDTAVASKDTDLRLVASTPADMFTPVVAKSPNKKPGTPKPVFKSKTLLAYNDNVPVYDARKVVLDFQSDLPRLDQVLPRFAGEVPFSSFIVVGYSASCYQAARSGSAEKVSQLGCNILWVIVCGTPVLRRK